MHVDMKNANQTTNLIYKFPLRFFSKTGIPYLETEFGREGRAEIISVSH